MAFDVKGQTRESCGVRVIAVFTTNNVDVITPMSRTGVQYLLHKAKLHKVGRELNHSRLVWDVQKGPTDLPSMSCFHMRCVS